MITVGRLCMKIAGRDAGKKCVVVEEIDRNYVLIDGETRRRKCNITHLEPLADSIDIKSKASHADVVAAFKKLGIELTETKPKKAGIKPTQLRAAERKKMAAEATKKEKKADKKAPKAKPVPSEKPEAAKADKPAEPIAEKTEQESTTTASEKPTKE